MKRNAWLIVMVSILVLFLTTPGFSWQGRMAGMGDASGLIEDESDYLTHPSAIASGKGLNAYGSYRFTYDKATQWDYKAESAVNSLSYPYEASGYEWKNQLQLGSAFALGAGRMGVFFEYEGVKGKYDGRENYLGYYGLGLYNFEAENKSNDFRLRLIYGMPLNSVNVGGEIQIAYRNEKKETIFTDEYGYAYMNYAWGAENSPALNLYPYMIPFESKYWEAQGKVSVDGSVGAAKYAFTLKGGMPFASDNNYTYIIDDYTDTTKMDGKVKGFNVGGDFWLRVPVSSSVVLPFVVSAEYKTIKRDGAGMDNWGNVVTYDHEAKNLAIKVGGGVDLTLDKGTKLAAGLYYDYLSIKEDTYNDTLDTDGDYFRDVYSDMPDQSEHRLTLKALAEKELSSTFVLRGGFSIFYGWVKSDYTYDAYYNGRAAFLAVDIPTSGSNMGVNASIGATVKIAQLSLEPFINGGYMKYKTSGDGSLGPFAANAEFEKTNWMVGGGLSVKF